MEPLFDLISLDKTLRVNTGIINLFWIEDKKRQQLSVLRKIIREKILNLPPAPYNVYAHIN